MTDGGSPSMVVDLDFFFSVSSTKIDRKIHLHGRFWNFPFGGKDLTEQFIILLWAKDKPTGTFCFPVVIDATVHTLQIPIHPVN
jgi:hypothetical protein